MFNRVSFLCHNLYEVFDNMRRIEDSLDFLIFENKYLKDRFSGNGDLKKVLELYLNEIDIF